MSQSTITYIHGLLQWLLKQFLASFETKGGVWTKIQTAHISLLNIKIAYIHNISWLRGRYRIPIQMSRCYTISIFALHHQLQIFSFGGGQLAKY